MSQETYTGVRLCETQKRKKRKLRNNLETPIMPVLKTFYDKKSNRGLLSQAVTPTPYTYKLCDSPHSYHPQLPTLLDTHKVSLLMQRKRTFNINTKTRYIIPIAITFGFCNGRAQYPLRVRYRVAFSLNGLWGKMYRSSFCVSLSSGHA